MSAARTASYSSPTSVTRLPVVTSKSDDLAGLGAHAAAGEQELAVAAELERRRRSLGERQDAEQFERLRCCRAATCFCPPTATSGAQGLAASAVTRRPGRSRDDRLDRQRPRASAAGRRACRLTVTTARFDLRLVRSRPSAADVSSAPPAIHLDRRRAPCRGSCRPWAACSARSAQAMTLKSMRAVGVAGLDHLAAAAAGDGAGVGGEVEAALLLVGVVAVEAGVAEDRQDVVLVGDLGRCARRHRRRGAARSPG